MTRYTILYAIMLLVLPMISCEKDVILNLSDKQGTYIIVDANLTDNGSRQWVRLSRSSSYYDVSAGAAVTGASVKIDDGETSYVFSEIVNDSLGGYYYNDFISNQLREKQLTLIIEYEGETFHANSSWRPLPEIDSIGLRINAFSELGFFPDTLYDVLVHFKELPEEGDHYLFNLFVNDTIRTSRPNDKGLVSDINLEEYVSLSVLNINKNDIRPNDQITLEMRSISQANFEFYGVFFFQTDLSGNPFAGAPPANIPTNLSEGARGFFQVSALNRKSIIYNASPD